MSKQKQQIKERIAASNLAVMNGLQPDPWVVQFRIKNNITKAKWIAKKPKKDAKPKKSNSGSFKKGQVPLNIKSPEHKADSLKRWKEGTREWHKKNREKINKQRREKRKNNPSFKLACNLRKRLSFLLRLHLVKKTNQTMTLLGCTMEDFMKHLESKFTDGMSFENYGEWHIDHILPCNSFDLSDVEQQKKCFHYLNMQPLWAMDNRIKSDRPIAKAKAFLRF